MSDCQLIRLSAHHADYLKFQDGGVFIGIILMFVGLISLLGTPKF